MSEMTTAILIYHQNLEELQTWVRKKKKNAYILQLTEDWIGLFIENDLRVGDKWAGTAAAELQKPVLFLGNYDEFGWKADFWKKGSRVVHIDLPFEQPRKAKVEVEDGQVWRAYASRPELVDQLHTLLHSPRRLDPGGVDLLKKAFGLESVTFLSYDYLYTYSGEALKEGDIIEVSGRKRPQLKQIILEIFKEPLEQKGYQLHPESGGRNMQHEYIFSKYIGSYRYQVRVENWDKNKLNLNYYPPYKLRSVEKWLNDNGYLPEFTFINELQLRTVLTEMLNSVMTKGLPWLEAQHIEELDLSEAFRELLDPIMEDRGFYRKNTWEDHESKYWHMVRWRGTGGFYSRKIRVLLL
ncbi:hypothetical protein J2Z22_003854 [Paenibacillus forsythiae]|uniref:Uncharacterized protein n=1 Tax=Paenibacillus forsythiae TaxID=365616 RepID=A0ABU3HBS1_9BACL|nr:hypothetical protein [Paenibacillus forsythiae]MDT3428262.1 hypothetical protein [Paenibacillus forsythiae]